MFNFISVAISIFISNFIIITIIRHLPIRKNQLWQLIIITIYNLGGLIFDIISLFSFEMSIINILYVLGNGIGVGIGYIATLMIILDHKLIFKSRRLKQFERDLKNNGKKSLSRNIISIVCVTIFIILMIYGIISLLHYDSSLLISIVGVFIGAGISLALAIYFFISGRPQHEKIKASNLLFVVTLPDQILLYHAKLTKENPLETALASLQELFYIDEYGLIITPTERYIVKGIHLETLNQELYEKIKLNRFYDSKFDEAVQHFQKYNRKRIILDENNQITKISNIK